MRFFGTHPEIVKFIRENEKSGKFVIPATAELSEFYSPRHPEVYLIPRDRYITVVDQWDDALGYFELPVRFSSYNFYQDFDFEGGIFNELYHTDAFWRLGDISQLGYLHSPKPINFPADVKIYYMTRQFPHTRWIHSLFTGMLAYVVLARNGFPLEQIKPFALAAACHDIAMPAGGDSVTRVDRQKLSEENNFSKIIKKNGLDKKWKKKFGFNLKEAEDWVRGHGAWGKLLVFWIRFHIPPWIHITWGICLTI